MGDCPAGYQYPIGSRWIISRTIKTDCCFRLKESECLKLKCEPSDEYLKKMFCEMFTVMLSQDNLSSYIAEELKSILKSDQRIEDINETIRELEQTFSTSLGRNSKLVETEVVEENYLLQQRETSKIVILSDIAGMGKTTTLLSIARKFKAENPSHWVFFLELNKYQNELRNGKFPDDLTAVNFVARNLLKLKGMDLKIFTDACFETGNVVLCFDAFDEISPDAEKIFPKLLNALEATKIKNFVCPILNLPNMFEDVGQQTPLLLACQKAKTSETAKYLINYPECQVDAEDNNGDSALHYASRNGYTDIIKILLDRETSLLNKQNKGGNTPLHLASDNGKCDAVKKLLNYVGCQVKEERFGDRYA
ncbi:hypothetical protein B566_EDAN016644 [Ephemera danica]|nr:hypothetical protein B566_EDAN016644 [Ephemera danica]